MPQIDRFDPARFTRVPEETWEKLRRALWSSKGAERAANLEKLFENGIPANAYVWRGFDYETILHLAVSHPCEVSAMAVLSRDPTLALSFPDPIGFFWRLPQVLSFLCETGVVTGVLPEKPGATVKSMLEQSGEAPHHVSIRLLAKNGVDVIGPCDGIPGVSMLLYAASTSTAPMFRALLDAGAAVNEVVGEGDALGSGVLHCAVFSTAEKSVDGKGWTKKSYDARMVNKFRMLKNDFRAKLDHALSAGVDVNLQNAAGDTALHTAARLARLDEAVALLEAGADPSLKNKQGYTALSVAKRCRNGDVITAIAAAAAKKAMSGPLQRARSRIANAP